MKWDIGQVSPWMATLVSYIITQHIVRIPLHNKQRATWAERVCVWNEIISIVSCLMPATAIIYYIRHGQEIQTRLPSEVNAITNFERNDLNDWFTLLNYIVSMVGGCLTRSSMWFLGNSVEFCVNSIVIMHPTPSISCASPVVSSKLDEWEKKLEFSCGNAVFLPIFGSTHAAPPCTQCQRGTYSLISHQYVSSSR